MIPNTIKVSLRRDKARTQMAIIFSKNEEEFIIGKPYDELEFFDFLEEELHYVNGSDYRLEEGRKLWSALCHKGWEEFK